MTCSVEGISGAMGSKGWKRSAEKGKEKRDGISFWDACLFVPLVVN